MWDLDDLIAKIDADEQAAREMSHWQVEDSFYHCCAALRTEEYAGDLPFGECDCGLEKRQQRALREVIAKRAIVGHALAWSATLHETPPDRTEAECTSIRMTMEWVIDRIKEIYEDDSSSS